MAPKKPSTKALFVSPKELRSHGLPTDFRRKSKSKVHRATELEVAFRPK